MFYITKPLVFHNRLYVSILNHHRTSFDQARSVHGKITRLRSTHTTSQRTNRFRWTQGSDGILCNWHTETGLQKKQQGGEFLCLYFIILFYCTWLLSLNSDKTVIFCNSWHLSGDICLYVFMIWWTYYIAGNWPETLFSSLANTHTCTHSHTHAHTHMHPNTHIYINSVKEQSRYHLE